MKSLLATFTLVLSEKDASLANAERRLVIVTNQGNITLSFASTFRVTVGANLIQCRLHEQAWQVLGIYALSAPESTIENAPVSAPPPVSEPAPAPAPPLVSAPPLAARPVRTASPLSVTPPPPAQSTLTRAAVTSLAAQTQPTLAPPKSLTPPPPPPLRQENRGTLIPPPPPKPISQELTKKSAFALSSIDSEPDPTPKSVASTTSSTPNRAPVIHDHDSNAWDENDQINF